MLTDYQNLILQSLETYEFRVTKMKGRCHDALVGEWINWWLGQNVESMICNPARSSKSGSSRYVADLLFLEKFGRSFHYRVTGVAEIENIESKISEKMKTLQSYESYTKRGHNVYPDLEFAILCYTQNVPNDELVEKVYHETLRASCSSSLLWIVCELGNAAYKEEELDYRIRMPNYVNGYDYFRYRRNLSSVFLYGIKKGKQVGGIMIPGLNKKQIAFETTVEANFLGSCV